MEDKEILDIAKGNALATAGVIRVLRAIIVCLARQPGIDTHLLLSDLRSLPSVEGEDPADLVYAAAVKALVAELEGSCQ